MATYTWVWQGSSPTTIGATDIIQFAGSGGFDTAVTVDAYNDTTHVESSIGADDSSGNTPNNNKFVSQTGGGGGDSEADWGDGTEDIDAILEAECGLEINFAHGSSVAVSSHTIWAYNDSVEATGPTDVDFRIAELADTNFTEAEGSGSALSVGDSSAATSHDFYFIVSASPTAVGEKTAFTIKSSLTYS